MPAITDLLCSTVILDVDILKFNINVLTLIAPSEIRPIVQLIILMVLISLPEKASKSIRCISEFLIVTSDILDENVS